MDDKVLMPNKTMRDLKSKKKNCKNSDQIPLRLVDSCEILRNIQTQRKDYSKTLKDLSLMMISENNEFDNLSE